MVLSILRLDCLLLLPLLDLVPRLDVGAHEDDEEGPARRVHGRRKQEHDPPRLERLLNVAKMRKCAQCASVPDSRLHW